MIHNHPKQPDWHVPLFFLYFAEKDGDPMFGSHRASDAFNAVCRGLGLDPDHVRRTFDKDRADAE